MEPVFTASVTILRIVVEAAVARGLDRKELLESIGVAAGVYEDPEGSVPHRVIQAAWEQIPARLGDEAFGLHLAEGMRQGGFDLFEYVLSHAENLGAAYKKLARYQRLVHDAAGLRFEVSGSVARITHQGPPSLVVPRHATEFFIAGPLAFGRRITGLSFSPIEVELPFPAPADDREHRRFFRAPIAFERPIASMTLDASLLSKPLAGADPTLGHVLERYADRVLSSKPSVDEPFMDRVRRLLFSELRGDVPQAADIARRLGVSERTLSRRLREDGVSFAALLDSVRREVATRRLGEPGGIPAEVAFCLGFSDVSAFYRAFRRWTGTTPAQFRRSVAGEAKGLASQANAASSGRA